MLNETIDPLQAAFERACAEVGASVEECRHLDAKLPSCLHVRSNCTEHLLAELLQEMRALRAALLAYLLPGAR